jgi:hypothetical protein
MKSGIVFLDATLCHGNAHFVGTPLHRALDSPKQHSWHDQMEHSVHCSEVNGSTKAIRQLDVEPSTENASNGRDW